jgi:adenine-specific DNA-methyltransferase
MPKKGSGKKSGVKKTAAAPKRVNGGRVVTGGAAPSRRSAETRTVTAKPYTHPEATSAMRPEIGTQAQFRKKKPPKSYRYDSSLAPELQWDEQNPAREEAEGLLKQITEATTLDQAKAAAAGLTRMGSPFLNWSGKAEGTSFDVPTLPLFVHERLSTQAILETLKQHEANPQEDMFDIFGDPKHSITDQVLRSYEHRDNWVNRLVLGDSLVVMNSLLHYEGLGGQVQMIYIDPPYGVKFGSNFQPFVRKRDVKHNDDADMTREPEMVQAYRDTWELGLHSYLTYLRDRLLVARELLTPSGSVFVQISDENLHHVREVMDEVFGAGNFLSVVSFITTTGFPSNTLSRAGDYLMWYARDADNVKYRQLFRGKSLGDDLAREYRWALLPNGSRRPLTDEERRGVSPLPSGAKAWRYGPLTSSGTSTEGSKAYVFEGHAYSPGKNNHWKVSHAGLDRLAAKGLLVARERQLAYYRFLDDYPVLPINNIWADTKWGFDAGDKSYVVQTNTKIVQRCILMTTDPGDLVLDPTCGSGTTTYVAEQWGRRWITIDTSRVPLALTRQRILTATYRWYELKENARGPAGGFAYRRKQNDRGEDIGGIVPHITLKSIANDEPPEQEVLVDRPEITKGITRVSGPFCVEATIPTPVDWEGDGIEDSGAQTTEEYGSFVDRMLEVLRRSPTLHLGGNKTVTLRNIRPPARSLSISAEATVDASALNGASLGDVIDEAEEKRGDRLVLSTKLVAIVFGPENGAVSEKLVYEAAREANAKSYSHLFVIGFAIEPNARELVERSGEFSVPATYIQATPDLLMGDLLKNMRSSQIFSVCGLPEVLVSKVPPGKNQLAQYKVELVGLDTFDPTTMEVMHRKGDDIPCWMLDTDYNGMVFRVSQAFFPRQGSWDALKRALRASYEESVWDHLAGTDSTPFAAGSQKKIAVKVIDDRGNELMVVKDLA